MSGRVEPRRPGLGLVGDAVGQVRWLLGARRRWTLLLPVLNAAAATSEVLLLVVIVRLLLVLVAGDDVVAVSVGPIEETLGITGLSLVALACSLGSITLRVAESLAVGRLSSRAASEARSRLIRSYFDADWQALSGMRAGELQQLLGQNVQTASTLVPQLATMIAALINLAIYGAVVVIAAPIVGLVFTVVGALVVSVFVLLRRRTQAVAASSHGHVRDVQLTATALSTLKRELQLFDVQEAAKREMEQLNADARSALTRLRAMQRLVPGLFQQMVLLSVLALIVLARSLDIDASSFGTAAILSLRSLSYLQQLNSSSQNYLESAPYVTEIRQAVESMESRQRPRGSVVLEPVHVLDLAGVHFRYGEAEVLRGIDLTISGGERVAVIGPSGGGKTTLVHVLAGLLTPSSGHYLVNGRDADDHDVSSWARQFAMLTQEPTLIRGTVRDNVRFYRNSPDAAEHAAAELASVRDDIEALPEGWLTRVGDGAGSLSGGQRQRVALARTLFGTPSVVVLDEPTASLDAENEATVVHALDGLPPNVTVIVVSHRPAVLEVCDRVVVIRDGQIELDAPTDSVSLDGYVAAAERDAQPDPP